MNHTDAAAIHSSGPPLADAKVMRDLHTLLLETEVREGKMICGNCKHEYKVKEGIANFLLPSHLGKPPSLTFTGTQVVIGGILKEKRGNLRKGGKRGDGRVADGSD